MEQSALSTSGRVQQQKGRLAYHLVVWQTELQCPGGQYSWNEKFKLTSQRLRTSRQAKHAKEGSDCSALLVVDSESPSRTTV